ncbi:hypothetical protein CVT24_000420 [Panaeolus cyanescens]|uniref:Uncharacterized protein n=1 Tax=Panaeolus cyanescens TaxID=181874 RepID=A0A409YDQ5_9AGAR|nr:hypothetical protein CVT24_000420 [Panaeolus cyanescens]
MQTADITDITYDFQCYPPNSTGDDDNDLEVPAWILVVSWDKKMYQSKIHHEVPQHCLVSGCITLQSPNTTPPIPSSFSTSSRSLPDRTHRTRNRVHPYTKMQYQPIRLLAEQRSRGELEQRETNISAQGREVECATGRLSTSIPREYQYIDNEKGLWQSLFTIAGRKAKASQRYQFQLRDTDILRAHSAMRLSAGPSLAPVTALAVPASFPSSSTTTTLSYMSEPWTPNQKGEIIMKLGPQEPCVNVDKPTVTRHHLSHFGGHGQAKRKYTKSGEKDEGQREKQQL